ncbi:MAG TPA: PilZ domain-containing protein [Polyangiaceae bacterium]|jgi:uncharacterized protein (TIGR02266 family)|nr:PilZ domain-containing protein [Polyangiaceae bacterium]
MMRSRDEAEFAKRVIDRSTAVAQVLVRERDEAERRVKPRYDVKLTVTLVGDHNFYVGLTENISEGGLFVQTQRALPIGATLHVEFSLPTSSEKVVVVGVVRWVRSANALAKEHDNFASGDEEAFKPGMGIQFVDMSPVALRAITKFIGIRNPDFYAD